jgi:DMATS type aromatic prenyltransferase
MVNRGERLGDLASRQLDALARNVELDASLPVMQSILSRLLGSSGQHPCGASAYPSDVVDDHSPYEMSVALGTGAAELRLLVETVDDDFSLEGRWRSARAAGAWLQSEHGANLDRLDRIAGLFEPRTNDALLALWHAIVFRKDAKPEAKAYLDLRAHGRSRAAALLEEALDRLDLAAAYPDLIRDGCRRGTDLDELVYFSLDLTSGPDARVKVYFRHHACRISDVERVIGRWGGVEPGDIRAFCSTILGGEGPYSPRPLVSCWSFSRGTEPSGATLYLPIAYYVRDDRVAQTRIQSWLSRCGISSDQYAACISAFARRPLSEGVGLHSYVSFKRDAGTPKVTCYLAPEANETFPPDALAARPLAAPTRPRKPTDLVTWFETQ